MCCRPDIAFATHYLSRFQQALCGVHIAAAKDLLVYLVHTHHLGLFFSAISATTFGPTNVASDSLQIYHDATFSGEPSDSSSVSGVVAFINGTPIYWHVSCKVSEADVQVYRAEIKRRAANNSIADEVKETVISFLEDHPDTIVSPISTDTIPVKRADGTKERVQKLLYASSLTALYIDFRNQNTTVKLGERALRNLMPRRLRRMDDRYKQMCGCRNCVEFKQLHATLLAWRRRRLKSAAPVSYDPQMEKRVDEVVDACCCPHVNGLGVPPFKCSLGFCGTCGVDKLYPVPELENATGYSAEKIDSWHYDYVNNTSSYGKERQQLELISEVMSIGDFHETLYRPKLTHVVLHLNSIRASSAHKQLCKELADLDISGIRDYSERFAFLFKHAIQSEHWKNASPSIEVSVIERIVRGVLGAPDEPRDRVHYHLSSLSHQDAAVTHENMLISIQLALDRGELRAGGTYWEKTDGCAKQYRCVQAFYLLSLLASTKRVSIDRQIDISGHGKDKGDGLGALIKRFFRRWLLLQGVLEDELEAHYLEIASMIGGSPNDHVAACIELAEREFCLQIAGVDNRDGSSASVRCINDARKRDGRLDEAMLHGYAQEDVKTWPKRTLVVPKGQTADGTVTTTDCIRAHFNFSGDPDLGLGWVAMRRAACGCPSCKTRLLLPWNQRLGRNVRQPRYAQNKSCTWWPVAYEGLNDWKICEVPLAKAGNDGDGDDASDAGSELDDAEMVLREVTDSLAAAIVVGNVGAVAADDDNPYYVVKFLGEPYSLQEDTTLQDFTPSIKLAAGVQVFKVTYFNSVKRAPHWYTLGTTADLTTIIPTTLLLHATLDLPEEGHGVLLPRGCAQTDARVKGAKRISDAEHDEVMTALHRRDVPDDND